MKPKRNISKKVYHLNLLPEHISKDIFLVGDQGRVSEISKRFDRIEHQITNREFITHTGYIGKKELALFLQVLEQIILILFLTNWIH